MFTLLLQNRNLYRYIHCYTGNIVISQIMLRFHCIPKLYQAGSLELTKTIMCKPLVPRTLLRYIPVRERREEKTKFGHVVPVLRGRYASEICDIILWPPAQAFKVLKAELTKRVCPSKRQRLQQLLHVEDLGDRKPPQLLLYIMKLRCRQR